MNQSLTQEYVTPDTLLARVAQLRDAGWRLVQICAALVEGLTELNYSFDRDGTLLNLRLLLPADGEQRVPSITPVYWCAFAYENELHDLFGITVEGNAVDFGGKFYTTSVRFPFLCSSPTAKPAS